MILLNVHHLAIFITLFITVFFSLCSPTVTASEQSRPNILFIFCDDLRYDAIGANGNDIIHTPNIDALAQRGVSFDQAFVTSTPV